MWVLLKNFMEVLKNYKCQVSIIEKLKEAECNKVGKVYN